MPVLMAEPSEPVTDRVTDEPVGVTEFERVSRVSSNSSVGWSITTMDAPIREKTERTVSVRHEVE